MRRGFHAATTAEISQEAGISVAGLYQYFPSKHDLILALVDLDLAFNLKMLEGLLEADDFMAVAESLLHSIAEDSAFETSARLRLEILSEACRSPEVGERLALSEREFKATLVRAIVGAQKRAQLSPSADPELLALAVTCLCDGVLSRLCMPESTRGAFAEAAIALLRSAAAPQT